MLVPIFTLKLNQKIFPRLVTVGCYDGKYPCLTGATNGGKVSFSCGSTDLPVLESLSHLKVFVHTPHHRTKPLQVGGPTRHHINVTSSADSDLTLFSFGQHITALAAGKLDPNSTGDSLLIGSQTNLLAYDVEKNSELFYKDVSVHAGIGDPLPNTALLVDHPRLDPQQPWSLYSSHC